MTKIAVFGAGGKMGAEVCRAVSADEALELVAAIDPHVAGKTVEEVAGVAGCDVVVASDPQAAKDAGASVAIDFTFAEVARPTLTWLGENGIHAVSGTTGFTETDVAGFERVFTSSNCVIAPNFAIGAVLMMKFAEMAAPYFQTAEIIELHHNNKRDAPSGTAKSTAERMAAASSDWDEDPTTDVIYEGSRGGEGPSGIRVHSVRMVGMVAHQEVLLGTTGQTLSIRHDSIDRTSFMPGVLLAAKAVAGRPGVTLGLDELLNL